MSDLTEKVVGRKNGEIKIDDLINRKKDFTSQVGKSSIILKFKDESGEERKIIYADEFKTLKYMGYLHKIKKEIESNRSKVMRAPKYKNASETNEYFKFSQKLNDYRKNEGHIIDVHDCYEVDLTAAYYQSAYRQGYISEELYNLILEKVPKDERLWLLGAIATSYCFTSYENGEVVGEPILKEDKMLRQAWKNICQHIDYVMIDIKRAINDEFLFYWVDGIYFKGEGDTREIFDRIRMVTWKHKLTFKTMPIPRMKITTTALGIEMQLFKANGKEKCFNVNKKLLVEYRTNSFKKLSESEEKALYSDFKTV